MFETSTFGSDRVKSGKAIVFQDKMTIYARPFPEAQVVTKLDKGKVFEFQAPEGAVNSGWHSVRTMDGQTGFIKATTKTTTREDLHRRRLELEQGIQLGIKKMFTGAGLVVAGGVVTVLSFLAFAGAGGILFYGMIGIGVVQFFWGLEQRANAIRALRLFNEEFYHLLG